MKRQITIESATVYQKAITLGIFEHRHMKCLSLRFPYDEDIRDKLMQLKAVRWTKTHKCFYLPYTEQSIRALVQHLRGSGIWVDQKGIKSTTRRANGATTAKVLKKRQKPSKPSNWVPLSEPIQEKIALYRRYMEQQRYSYSTVKTYSSMIRQFFAHHHPKNWDSITEEDLVSYNHQVYIKRGRSYASQNQFINAIKLFYKLHASSQIVPDDIARPRRVTKLPDVLTKEEVKSILIGITNLKHQALISLLYGCGLRIGEALSLRIDDVRYEEKLLYVRSAKGQKDRRVPLSGGIADLLRRYQRSYRNKTLLFTGQRGGRYAYSSALQILKRAVRKAGLNRRVTLHTLRHSYATHLLQSGTDLRYIQTILGHNSPKTTMLYTHVAAKDLKNIKSPFDDLGI